MTGRIRPRALVAANTAAVEPLDAAAPAAGHGRTATAAESSEAAIRLGVCEMSVAELVHER